RDDNNNNNERLHQNERQPVFRHHLRQSNDIGVDRSHASQQLLMQQQHQRQQLMNENSNNHSNSHLIIINEPGVKKLTRVTVTMRPRALRFTVAMIVITTLSTCCLCAGVTSDAGATQRETTQMLDFAMSANSGTISTSLNSGTGLSLDIATTTTAASLTLAMTMPITTTTSASTTNFTTTTTNSGTQGSSTSSSSSNNKQTVEPKSIASSRLSTLSSGISIIDTSLFDNANDDDDIVNEKLPAVMIDTVRPVAVSQPNTSISKRLTLGQQLSVRLCNNNNNNNDISNNCDNNNNIDYNNNNNNDSDGDNVNDDANDNNSVTADNEDDDDSDNDSVDDDATSDDKQQRIISSSSLRNESRQAFVVYVEDMNDNGVNTTNQTDFEQQFQKQQRRRRQHNDNKDNNNNNGNIDNITTDVIINGGDNDTTAVDSGTSVTAVAVTASTATANEGGKTQEENCLLSAMARQKEISVPVKLLFYLAYTTIFLFGLFGNMLVIYIVWCNKSMHTVTNYFIANLAVSDILLCLFAVPFTPLYLLTFQEWIFGRWLCHLLPYAQGVSVYISAFTLMIIAIDRYFVIVYPFRPRMSKCLCIKLIMGVWCAALLLTLPYALYVRLMPSDCPTQFCEEDWPYESNRILFGLSTSVLQFIVPFKIIAFCYIKVWLKLRMRARRGKPGAASANNHGHAYHPAQLPLSHTTSAAHSQAQHRKSIAVVQHTTTSEQVAGGTGGTGSTGALISPLVAARLNKSVAADKQPLASQQHLKKAVSSTARACDGQLSTWLARIQPEVGQLLGGTATGTEMCSGSQDSADIALSAFRAQSANQTGSGDSPPTRKGRRQTSFMRLLIGASRQRYVQHQQRQRGSAALAGKRDSCPSLAVTPTATTTSMNHHSNHSTAHSCRIAQCRAHNNGLVAGTQCVNKRKHDATDSGAAVVVRQVTMNSSVNLELPVASDSPTLRRIEQKKHRSGSRASIASILSMVGVVSDFGSKQGGGAAQSQVGVTPVGVGGRGAIAHGGHQSLGHQVHEDERDRRTRKTNRMLIAMVVIFLISWLPLNLHNLIQDLFIDASDWNFGIPLFLSTHTIAVSSTCYNPLVYAWLNDSFRKEFKAILPCFRSASSNTHTSASHLHHHHHHHHHHAHNNNNHNNNHTHNNNNNHHHHHTGLIGRASAAIGAPATTTIARYSPPGTTLIGGVGVESTGAAIHSTATPVPVDSKQSEHVPISIEGPSSNDCCYQETQRHSDESETTTIACISSSPVPAPTPESLQQQQQSADSQQNSTIAQQLLKGNSNMEQQQGTAGNQTANELSKLSKSKFSLAPNKSVLLPIERASSQSVCTQSASAVVEVAGAAAAGTVTAATDQLKPTTTTTSTIKPIEANNETSMDSCSCTCCCCCSPLQPQQALHKRRVTNNLDSSYVESVAAPDSPTLPLSAPLCNNNSNSNHNNQHQRDKHGLKNKRCLLPALTIDSANSHSNIACKYTTQSESGLFTQSGTRTCAQALHNNDANNSSSNNHDTNDSPLRSPADCCCSLGGGITTADNSIRAGATHSWLSSASSASYSSGSLLVSSSLPMSSALSASTSSSSSSTSTSTSSSSSSSSSSPTSSTTSSAGLVSSMSAPATNSIETATSTTANSNSQSHALPKSCRYFRRMQTATGVASLTGSRLTQQHGNKKPHDGLLMEQQQQILNGAVNIAVPNVGDSEHKQFHQLELLDSSNNNKLVSHTTTTLMFHASNSVSTADNNSSSSNKQTAENLLTERDRQ
ncbi:RYamide receptor, partial [Fragariocoptes setiger]